MVDAILSSASQGLQTGLNNAARDAYKLSLSYSAENSSTNDSVDAAVGLIQDELQVAASAKVIKVADQLKGTLLDIFA